MSFTVTKNFVIKNAAVSSRSTGSIVGQVFDPLFKYVSTLIKGTNVNNGTNNVFTDDGTTKTCKTYINGTQVQSSSNSGFAYSSASPAFPLAIGRYQDTTPGDYFSGNIDEFRITRGVVRYTASFTAPTASFPTQ